MPHGSHDWTGSEEFVSGVRSRWLAHHPDVWTDGGLVRDEVSDVCCSGSGFLQLLLGLVGFIALGDTWISCRLVLILGMSNVDFTFRFPSRCRPFKESNFGGLIVALQAARPIHLGVDNANVVGHVGRIIANKDPMRPFELLTDGDLLCLVKMLVLARGGCYY